MKNSQFPPLFDRMGRPLCRGYLVIRIDRERQEIIETRFARLNDGRIFQANERTRSSSFNTEGDEWVEVKEKPEGAEFIGNYPIPGSISKAVA